MPDSSPPVLAVPHACWLAAGPVMLRTLDGHPPTRLWNGLRWGMALGALLVGLVATPSARGATFSVTAGSGDPDPSAGCQPAACSLREAVMAASGAPGSTVTVPAGHYVLSRPDTGLGSDSPTTGDLEVGAAMTIVGAGAASTTVDANGIDRVFDVPSSNGGCPSARHNVSISGMTVTGGANGPASTAGPVCGAGIFDCDNLSLSGVVLTHNTASGAGGPFRSRLVPASPWTAPR